MSRIFLSHSSKDDFAAIAIRGWLNENGWNEVFLDLDAKDGIHPGERWERALYEHAVRCEAVVFLVSRNWLASEWCRREFELARRLNKRIFVALIDDLAISELPPFLTETLQAVSLAAGADHQVHRAGRPGTDEERHITFSAEGLARLKAGLAQAGLDPRFFAWPPANDPDRDPYRGLEPLEAGDAGIFFGRDAPVIEALDALRGVRENNCPRLYVILGASGAGKSSFLRAGILPRLSRDDSNFLPLTPVRPERAAVTGANGLVAVLAAACAERGMAVTRAQLRDAAAQGADALRPYLRELATRARGPIASAKGPTIVIPVDQAEELFRAEGIQEGEALLVLLRELALKDDPAIIALFAIRSDSYDALEHAKALEGLSQKAFPLLPMPRGAYQTVIEGPASRFERNGRKFEIDPSLTQALLADLEKGGASDSLPLLAFTLGQLFTDNKAAGRLTRADYDKFGGLKGAIDAAVARVFVEADKDARIPRDNEARLALLRRGLVPWLAGIDPETKTPRRRRAPAAQIPQEARPLIDLLVEQRLLTRAVDDATQEVMLEPAHEALLRQWGSLKGWLDEDFARLVTLEGVKRASRDWDANARDSAWAAHSGGRLEEAARLDTRPDLAALLDASDRAYMAACREKQNAAHAREQALAAAEGRAARRTRIGLAASIVLGLMALGAAVYGFSQAKIAGQQKQEAEGQKTIAEQQKQEAEKQKAAAEQQKQEAERQKGVAEQQKQEAERQKTAAEQQKQEAERQTLRAEQRSAVLAADISDAFTAEGALDQALLLMLDAARVFDDKNVPDKLRIALTKTLQKRQRVVENTTLFPDMQVFETDDALLLLNPATNDIWKLTNTTKPQRFVAGAAGDGKITKLRHRQNGKDYIVLRENFDVERIEATSGTRQKLGRFAPPARPAGEEPVQAEISEDGLVSRVFLVPDGKGGIADGKSLTQILDPDTGRTTLSEMAIGSNASIVRRRPAGGFYATDGENLVEIVPVRDRFTVQPTKLPEQERNALQYGPCIASMPAASRKMAIDQLSEFLVGGRYECRRFGNAHLLETNSHTSAGEDQTFWLFQDGKKFDVRETLKGLMTASVSGTNFAWVTALPTAAQQATPDGKGQALAILSNRDAYVLSTDDAAGDLWSLALNYRHPAFVKYARFLAPDLLAAIDPEAGQLTVHDLRTRPKDNLFGTKLDDLIDTSAATPTLHIGSCVGYSISKAETARLPDGREIRLQAPSDAEKQELTELKVTGDRPVSLPIDKDVTCFQFSADWKRLVMVKESSAIVYDFEKALATGMLTGNEIGTIPENINSAFFVGTPGRQIVTSNSTNRVRMWTQAADGKAWTARELFKGDNRIIYAEPDATAERLILLEATGGGGVHGVLYSLTAHQVWFDLGSDYKWLGAAFTPNAEVVVAEHSEWKRVFPLLPLSRLVELAVERVSSKCRPPTPRDYRNSPCWMVSSQ